MNANELTADYICENSERLQMALRVYDAMSTVRERLIRRVFEAVGDRIRVDEKLDGMDVWVEKYEYCVQFYTEETRKVYVYAELSGKPGKRGYYWLHAGLYTDEGVGKSKQDEMRERFEAMGDLETWSDAEKEIDSSSNYVAKAYVHEERGDARWDGDNFLRQAIQNQDEVVSGVAEILLQIYEGVFVS